MFLEVFPEVVFLFFDLTKENFLALFGQNFQKLGPKSKNEKTPS